MKAQCRLSSRGLALTLMCWLILALDAPASAQANSRTTEQLIDDLTQIDGQSIGINSAGVYDGFLAEGTKGHFRGGVLGVGTPAAAPQIIELVRRGPAALPELLRHLNDARPTKLAVGNDAKAKNRQIGVNVFMFMLLSDEYDPRILHDTNAITPTKSKNLHEVPFDGMYKVKIADVCFVIIGQIVNRNLYAVRYQPSAGLVINSPIEAPILANEVKADWGNIDSNALKASLLDDIRISYSPHPQDRTFSIRAHAFGALTRLRFYFPQTYESLAGENLKMRRDFEAHHGDPYN